MNNDLISRSALKKWADDSIAQYGNQYSTDMLNMFGLFKEVIDNAQSTPLPDFKEGYKQAIRDGKTNFSRPQGEWMPQTDFRKGTVWKCSECGSKNLYLRTKFCPFCGAKMGGEE